MNTKTIIPVIVDGNHGCTLWKMPTARNPHFEPILFDRESGAYIGHIIPADTLKEGDETVDTVAVTVAGDEIEIMDINTLADRKGFDRCGITLAIIRKI
ncbi:hypothetical protein QP992_08915 [Corynebacterium ulcerans]|uniref:hypothetical protein n=1 Tax=Corynebacterium ulcerans TaxID=65058 RepID=UPI002550D44E|nr:hypothetical protein [Corynebacterium ulcerans]MDK8889264.1 hypothetical protein [Corynebacterium ulcerans]